MRKTIFDFFEKIDNISRSREVANWYANNIIVIPSNELTEINVSIRNGNLQIKNVESDKVEIYVKYLSKHEKGNDELLQIENKINKLQIVSDEKKYERNVILNIPQQFSELEFDVLVENGDFNVDSVSAKGIKIVSKNGKLNLKKIRSNELFCEAKNGEITVEKSFTGKTIIRSDIGDVLYIGNCIQRNQSLKIKTNNGNIKFAKSDLQFNKEMISINAVSENGIVKNEYIVNNHIRQGSAIVSLLTKNGNIKVTK